MERIGKANKNHKTLKREMLLHVYHETHNPYADKALRIETMKGDKLGYTPVNIYLAPMPQQS